MVVVEAEIGWDGRLLGPPRVAGTENRSAARLSLAAESVDELHLTLHPRLGVGEGTLTDATPFPTGSTAWRLAEMTRGTHGRCHLRYVRAEIGVVRS